MIAQVGSKIDILASYTCISIIDVKMMDDACDVLTIRSKVNRLITKLAHLLIDLVTSHKDIFVVYCLVFYEPVLGIIVPFSFIGTVTCDPLHLIVGLFTIILFLCFAPPL